MEWGEYGIRVVSIAPGPIEGTTGGPGGRVFGISDPSNAEADFLGEAKDYSVVPIGRWGRVSDIANTVLFVTSEAASFITATNIVVDGGQWHGTSGFYHSLKDVVASKSNEEKKSFKGGVPKASL